MQKRGIMVNQNLNIGDFGLIYGKWLIGKNTYTISFQGRVYSYLLIGTEKALLIDTAYGEGNLREFVEEITDKPVTVVNTHGHFDHTGGNPWWAEVYASKNAIPVMKKAFSPQMQEAFSQKTYPNYKVNVVENNFQFNLGNRTVDVIEIPAHSDSSIALLDKESRLLFSGDELEAGQVLMFGNDPHEFQHHLANMQKLKQISDNFDYIMPAHNGSPISKKYIDDFIELDKQIMAGTQTFMPNLAGFGFPAELGSINIFDPAKKAVRSQFGNASFCYTLSK